MPRGGLPRRAQNQGAASLDGSLHSGVDARGQFLDPAHILVAEFAVDMAVVQVLNVPMKRGDDARELNVIVRYGQPLAVTRALVFRSFLVKAAESCLYLEDFKAHGIKMKLLSVNGRRVRSVSGKKKCSQK